MLALHKSTASSLSCLNICIIDGTVPSIYTHKVRAHVCLNGGYVLVCFTHASLILYLDICGGDYINAADKFFFFFSFSVFGIWV